MNRAELTLAVAATLIASVMLGWLLAWIAGRLNGRGPRAAAEARDLEARVTAAAAAGRHAETRLAQVEADLGARLLEAETELAAAHARLERERAQTEQVRTAYREAMDARRSGAS